MGLYSSEIAIDPGVAGGRRSKGSPSARVVDWLVNVDMGDVQQPARMIRVMEDYVEAASSPGLAKASPRRSSRSATLA